MKVIVQYGIANYLQSIGRQTLDSIRPSHKQCFLSRRCHSLTWEYINSILLILDNPADSNSWKDYLTITGMNFLILKLLPTHLMKGDAPAKTMSCRSTKKAKMKVLWKFISRLEVKILGAQALLRHTRSSRRHHNLLYSCVCSSFSYLLAVWRSQKGQTCVQRRRHQL